MSDDVEEIDFLFAHPSVRQYIDYVDNTESPRIFHVWSFLSGISAAMGRRCWLPMGTGEVFPNQYIILTGPPAVRKSTAFKIVCSLLRRHSNVKFAPDDCAGQRQGLISAMMNCAEGQNDGDREIIERLTRGGKNSDGAESNVNLADLSSAVDALGDIHLDTRDPYTMLIAASELNSILGEGNTALLTFLIKMWDGDPYKYQLKKDQIELKDALLGIIAATTPSQLSLAMPQEAVGQGFTSRVIFVFADKKHARRIARPSLRLDLEKSIGDTITKVSEQFNGPFEEEPKAAFLLDELYERGITISDPRFVHYADRRHTHLQKLCMSLAASRGDMCIRLVDVKFADKLLMYTETLMPDALGEYGMNKLSAAKQKLLEYVNHSDEPIPTRLLFAMLSRDMSQMDFKNTCTELHNAGKVSVSTVPGLGQCIVATSVPKTRHAKQELNEIENLLTSVKRTG